MNTPITKPDRPCPNRRCRRCVPISPPHVPRGIWLCAVCGAEYPREGVR